MAKAKCVYDFDPEENADPPQVTLRVGDTITLLESEDEHGWWRGTVDHSGQTGWFPADYVESVGVTPSAIVVGVPTNLNGKAEEKTPLASEVIGPSANILSDTREVSAKLSNETRTRFGIWASNMGVICAFACLLTGFGSLWFSFMDFDRFGGAYVGIAFYAFALSVALYWFEMTRGSYRTDKIIPYRGMAYVVLSIPLFLTIPCIFAGGCMILTAGVHTVSALKREHFEPEPREKSVSGIQGLLAPICPCFVGGKEKTEADYGLWEVVTMRFSWDEYRRKLRREDRAGELVFLFLYFMSNVVIWFYYLGIWVDKINDIPSPFDFSMWIPLAKAFGSCLDFNIVLLLLPVSRSLIRWLYDHSTVDMSCSARFLRHLLYFVPLDKSLEFHMLIAWVMSFHAIGHAVSHLFNYAVRPGLTWDVYGITVWLTGGGLFACMLFLYAAVNRNVKSRHFEIFWFSHHLFVPFFILCLIHGKDTWGPNFWKWLIFPGTVYTCERLYREYKQRQAVVLHSVTHQLPNVFCLELGKSGPLAEYKEGQYLFLNCPYVAGGEWHPFTISSAPQEETVTLHIRAQGPGSWTSEVQNYLKLMGGRDKAHTRFERMEGNKRVAGKIVGADNKPLFRVFGPLSAPTQHLPEYQNVMIVASGIGVTPLTASLKSVVHHRWKYFMGRTYPDRAHFYWMCTHDQLPEYRWVVRVVKEACDGVKDMQIKQPDSMKSKSFRIHLFVTSYRDKAKLEDVPDNLDENADISFWGMPNKEARQARSAGAGVQGVLQNHVAWTEAQLYRTLQRPPKEPTVIGEPGNEVVVHNGRPDWATLFQEYASEIKTHDTGVCFCGNPRIAADLYNQCKKHTTDARIFRLHKENF